MFILAMILLTTITIFAMLYIDELVYNLNKIKINTDVKIKLLLILLYIAGLFFSRDIWLYTAVFNITAHIAAIDEQEQIIPNKYIVFLLMLGIVLNLWDKNFIHIIMATVIYLVSIIIIVLLEKLANKTYIGGGDLKYIYALNMIFGNEYTIITLFFTSLFLLINIGKDRKMVALGKYFLISFVAAMIFF